VQISIAKGELPKAQSVLSEAQKQYPASDPWLILMQAALEQAEWKREQGGKGTP
jgi:ATP/maltotriose-dependent transcriptional regulator MalT